MLNLWNYQEVKLFFSLAFTIGKKNASFEVAQASPVCPSDNNKNIKTKIIIKHLWDDTNDIKFKYSNKNLSN